jgi:tetratricopeptide (TPR) repeat protein
LLDGALQLAEDGSWERIAVGRAWYLGGDKAKGQQIFDSVTSSRKVEDSDWFRIGRVYAEAGEWGKAQAAFERAFAMNADDDSGMIEVGALANVNKDRERAEALFERAMKKNPREFWHWVGAGASYLGVRPQ